MQEASSYRAKARDEVPDGSDERGLAYINDALATLPDSPRLLINRAYFDLAMGDVTATVRFPSLDLHCRLCMELTSASAGFSVL